MATASGRCLTVLVDYPMRGTKEAASGARVLVPSTSQIAAYTMTTALSTEHNRT